MNKIFLAIIPILFLAHHAQAAPVCNLEQGPIIKAVYCGTKSVPGGGGTGAGGAGTPLACAFWVAPSGGNDSNTGTSPATPFATLEKAQTAMRGVLSNASKVTCLKSGSGGTYNRTTSLTLTSSDSNETWQYDPTSGANTAIIDGGSTVDLIIVSGANNVTIDGLKLQNPLGACIHTPAGGVQITGLTIENNECAFNHGSIADGTADGFPNMILVENAINTKILNNYVHDTIHDGIGLSAFFSGESIDGGLISGNVVIRTCQQITDCGAISTDMAGTGPNGGSVSISNNFIRDVGQPGVGGLGMIYLDDYSSHVTVKGNIVGPPIVGWSGSSGRQDGQCFELHNGANNTVEDNFCDLGSTSRINPMLWDQDGNSFGVGMVGNIYSNNINISNFAGSSNSNPVICQGCAYVEQGGVVASDFTISNNAYHNYGGGVEPTNGSVIGDSSPQHITATSLKCSGYLYNLDPTSLAEASPVSFVPPTGGWGPPGFVIPTSTNHSCP